MNNASPIDFAMASAARLNAVLVDDPSINGRAPRLPLPLRRPGLIEQLAARPGNGGSNG